MTEPGNMDIVAHSNGIRVLSRMILVGLNQNMKFCNRKPQSCGGRHIITTAVCISFEWSVMHAHPAYCWCMSLHAALAQRLVPDDRILDLLDPKSF